MGRSEEVQSCNMEPCGEDEVRRQMARSPEKIIQSLSRISRRERDDNLGSLLIQLMDLEADKDWFEEWHRNTYVRAGAAGVGLVLVIAIFAVVLYFCRGSPSRKNEGEGGQLEEQKLLAEESNETP